MMVGGVHSSIMAKDPFRRHPFYPDQLLNSPQLWGRVAGSRADSV